MVKGVAGLVIIAVVVWIYWITAYKMKKVLSVLMIVLAIGLSSCDRVQSGHRGVEVSWGGKTNMETIYNEGMQVGFKWATSDLVNYDVREKTLTQKFSFNDTMNMVTPVEISIDYSLDPSKVNIIHSMIGKDQLEVKIITTLSSAAKQVIPQFTAAALNLTKREAAEHQIYAILQNEFPAFYVNCSRVRITDVDIPKAISDAAEQTARQVELNKLATQKVLEAEQLYEAALHEAKTKDILSQPAMLKLEELAVEKMWAQKGVSPYGSNNVFGADTKVVKGLK